MSKIPACILAPKHSSRHCATLALLVKIGTIDTMGTIGTICTIGTNDNGTYSMVTSLYLLVLSTSQLCMSEIPACIFALSTCSTSPVPIGTIATLALIQWTGTELYLIG